MNTKGTDSTEILAIFSTFKERRIKLYESFIKDIEDFDHWAISAERLVAYYLTLRNVKLYGNELKEKVQKEIIRLTEGDFVVQ